MKDVEAVASSCQICRVGVSGKHDLELVEQRQNFPLSVIATFQQNRIDSSGISYNSSLHAYREEASKSKQESTGLFGGADMPHHRALNLVSSVPSLGDIDHNYTGRDGSVASSRQVQLRNMSGNLCLVMLVGVAAFAIVLSVGLVSVKSSQQSAFEIVVEEGLGSFERVISEYLTLGLWTHEACLEAQESMDPRSSYRRFWNYIQAGNFSVQFVGCAVNVTHPDRASYENETQTFLSKSNSTIGETSAAVLYVGFKEPKSDPQNGTVVYLRRGNYPFYIPVHYVEPMEESAVSVSLDLDMYSLPHLREEVSASFATGQPVATGRINRGVQFGVDTDYPNYGVSIAHPGVNEADNIVRHVAWIPLFCNDVLLRTKGASHQVHHVKIVAYDTTPDSTSISGIPGPNFLCGAKFTYEGGIEFVQEASMEQTTQVDREGLQSVQKIEFASREWTLMFSASAMENSRSPMPFIILGAVLILISTLSLSLLIYTNAKKIRKIGRMKASVEAEKVQIRLENARKAAQQERDLNDFIAHEVRNPLNAALAANTFVSASVNELQPLATEQKRQSVREDVQIIDNSLHFINDLLRNMLDMQRAASHQLKIELSLVDLKRDILEPVASMLYRRGVPFEVLVDCQPEHLIVESDSLRLKQIVLNLGRNAAKFVQKGFVRLRTSLIDDYVHIFIEDSGPGVPLDKQDNLFGRFQESLDSLNQGTGIGLALCKNLTELLGGRIWLDKNYESGIEGCPGACFVINLRTPPIENDENEFSKHECQHLDNEALDTTSPTELALPSADTSIQYIPQAAEGRREEIRELPTGLSVLFVDDDFTLRKLFVRAVNRITDDWKIDQASNGETAVVKVSEGNNYDIIFMDMYMASTTKQLLGTEATRELRAKGCKSIIFGLSANDLESQFLQAGGDGFIMKPFPCKPEPLREELLRVLRSATHIQYGFSI